MVRHSWLLIALVTLSCLRDRTDVTVLDGSSEPVAPGRGELAATPDVTSEPTGDPVEAVLTDAPDVPPPTHRTKPARVVVRLEVSEVVKTIAPGVTYNMWTFGGSAPGKFIRVRQGDVVEMHLRNHPSSKLPHNIDLHAVTGPGGGAESSFTAPGHESVFTFRATNPGLFVYHCATAPVPMHVANGMYGLILVEPPVARAPARELYIMQSELYTSGKYHAPGLQEFDLEKGIDEKPTYVLFNGAEGSLTGPRAIKAKTGERIRIYVGNAGPNLVSNFHVIGEIFDVVYAEGGARPQEHVQTTLVPAGGSTIVEFTVDVPGRYVIVDHALFRAFDKGAIGMIEVEGPARPDVYSGRLADRPYAPSGGAPAPTTLPASASTSELRDLGRKTYERVCATCHGRSGRGRKAMFPPLAGSDYLARASTDVLVGHILEGLDGPLVVNGVTYDELMPAMSHLSDDEIAGVLTYIGSAWGNTRPPVRAAEVGRVRDAGEPR